MITCEALQHRLPEVVGLRGSLHAEEREHLVGCPDCRRALDLGERGARLGAGLRIDADRVAAGVVARLRAAPVEPQVFRPARFSWRGALAGVVAAAAGIALVLVAPRQRAIPVPGVPAVGIGALPELDALNEQELERVLAMVEPSGAVMTAGGAPRLGDLTEQQLEDLMQQLEGE